jgi:hypothetical protein
VDTDNGRNDFIGGYTSGIYSYDNSITKFGDQCTSQTKNSKPALSSLTSKFTKTKSSLNHIFEFYCLNETTFDFSYDICTFGCVQQNIGGDYCWDGKNCVSDSQCGTDEFRNEYSCSDNHNLFRVYSDYECVNAGNSDAHCEWLNNNTYEFEKYCEYQCLGAYCAYPDLYPSDLIVQKVSGRDVTLGFTVNNWFYPGTIGNYTTTNVFWKVDSNSPDADFERTTPIILEGGNSTRAYAIIHYSVPGTYNPRVIVDQTNFINETDETNNDLSIQVRVR